MQTKAEILASNPNLISYRVMLHEDKGDKFQIVFDCYAEDDDHAAEQAQNAYPNGEILSTTPFVGNDDVIVEGGNSSKAKKTPSIDWELLRKQKASLVSMAGEDDRLTSEVETLDGDLPVSSGGDAKWIELSEAEKLFAEFVKSELNLAGADMLLHVKSQS